MNLHKQLTWVLLLLASVNPVLAQSTTSHQHHQLIGSHGMVLLYDEQTGFYASHLPLYHSPHHYQIIYRVKIANSEPIKALIKHSQVTLLPQKFDLNKLINKQRFSITSTFYSGHFERGGKKIATEQLLFDQPVLIKKVQPTFITPKAHFYIAPIDNNKAIFVHKIQQAPSFDAIGFTSLQNHKLACNKPTSLTIKTIQEQLTTCGLHSIRYIEIQDFKN